jgi:hypothetical protein
MTVLVVAGNEHGQETVLCVICLQHVPFSEVTAGSHFADGHQAFACNKHLHDRTRWITEWAMFDAQQRNIARSEATDL